MLGAQFNLRIKFNEIQRDITVGFSTPLPCENPMVSERAKLMNGTIRLFCLVQFQSRVG